MPSRRLPALLVALLTGLLLAGCGSSSDPGAARTTDGAAARPREASLLLDFQPNAVHAGIYAALERGYAQRAGLDLRVRVPGATTDGISLLRAGRVDAAVLDIHDLALARERGADLVGVMPIVERPLASVLAQPGVRSPRELEGQRVGVTGAPSDDAVLDAVVRGAGGDPARVRRVQVGFAALRQLATGRVRAATAFWNAEGVQWRTEKPGAAVFRVDDFGAPSYPELVLTTTRTALDRDPGLYRTLTEVLRRGYAAALADPPGALDALAARVPGFDRAGARAQLAAVLPAFRTRDGRVEAFDASALSAWSAWEQRVGIVRERPDVARAFADG